MGQAVSDAAPLTTCATLLVHTDGERLETLVTGLRQLGVDAHGVRSFEGAKEQLARRAWNVLVADIRLGAYNGLHLAVRARAAQPRIHVILIDHGDDPAVAAETAACGASYIPASETEALLVAIVSACGRAAASADLTTGSRAEA